MKGDVVVFFFSSRRRHTRYIGDWSSDVCSSDLQNQPFYDPSAFAAVTRPGTGPNPYGNVGRNKIGRASCRERVEVSVVAVAVKKKGTSKKEEKGGGTVERRKE